MRPAFGEPGWADREIRSAPLFWHAAGYPVVRSGQPSARLLVTRRSGLAAEFPEGLDRAA